MFSKLSCTLCWLHVFAKFTCKMQWCFNIYGIMRWFHFTMFTLISLSYILVKFTVHYNLGISFKLKWSCWSTAVGDTSELGCVSLWCEWYLYFIRMYLLCTVFKILHILYALCQWIYLICNKIHSSQGLDVIVYTSLVLCTVFVCAINLRMISVNHYFNP